MHILIAPNAFKHSLDSLAAAEAIKEGLAQSGLECSCECFPIADGGDGTGELIIERCEGTRVNIPVHDPLGRMINAAYGIIDQGRTAVIEMANASGIRLLRPSELNPLQASTFGTGELIIHALREGATKIIIALGGSATVDGGTGILRALGIKFFDPAGDEITNLPCGLINLASIDTSKINSRIRDCKFIILCDVDNTLLGEHGSAAVFGPQKGASADDIKALENSLTLFRDVSLANTGIDMGQIKHGGAAGGAAAGLKTFLNAELVNGIDYFLQLTNFDAALQKADIVITGEGSIDVQTLQGKGPFGVALRARQKTLPVIGLAGQIPSEKIQELHRYFDVLLSICNEPLELDEALKLTRSNLLRTAREIGNLLAIKQS